MKRGSQLSWQNALWLLLCLFTCTFHAAASEESALTLFHSAEKRGWLLQKDLTKYLNDSSRQQWLSNTAGQQFLSLFLADQTGENLGLVIILPGIGHLPTQPSALEHLRVKLPENGWSTLSIGLNNDDQLIKQTFEKPSSASKVESDNPTEITALNDSQTQLAQAISQSFQQRLIAATPVIENSQPKQVHILASGLSGLWLFEALQDGLTLPIPSSIILFDAYQPENYRQTNLTQVSIATDYPLLDIALVHPQSIEQSNIRKIKAQQQQKLNYRQIRLEQYQDSIFENDQLLRAVIGWMKKISKGKM